MIQIPSGILNGLTLHTLLLWPWRSRKNQWFDLSPVQVVEAWRAEIYAQKDGQMVKGFRRKLRQQRPEKQSTLRRYIPARLSWKYWKALVVCSANAIHLWNLLKKANACTKSSRNQQQKTVDRRWWNSWVNQFLQVNQRRQHCSRSADYLKKEYRSSQLPQKWLMEKLMQLFASKSIWSWSQLDIYTRNRLKSVLPGQSKYLIQLKSQRSLAQPTSILGAWTGSQAGKTCPRFQRSLWQDWHMSYQR